MTVESILKTKGREVVTVAASATAEQAARLMAENNIGALVVRDSGWVNGLLTQRDLAVALGQHGSRAAAIKVESLMRSDFPTVAPDDTSKRVMSLMTRRRVTHIPVMDSDRLLGIVSLGDIVKGRLDDLEMETNVLRDAYLAAPDPEVIPAQALISREPNTGSSTTFED